MLSKQTALFVLPGQLLVLSLRFGFPRALGHALAAAVATACVFFASASLFGSTPDATWFYLLSVPSKHGIRWDDNAVVVSRAFTFVAPLVPMSAAVVWSLGGCRSLVSPQLRASMPLDVLLIAASGITLGPVSLEASMKVGGYLNNLHAHYYLLSACALGLVDALRDQRLSASTLGSRLTYALLACNRSADGPWRRIYTRASAVGGFQDQGISSSTRASGWVAHRHFERGIATRSSLHITPTTP